MDRWEETKKASEELIYEKLEAEINTELYVQWVQEQEQNNE